MARHNIVTFDKYRKPRNACHDDGYRDDSDALFRLSQKLTDLNARFAAVESVQAQALALANLALDSSLNPRSIVSVAIINGRLIISFSDGTTQDAGALPGGIGDPATIYNTLDDTQIRPMDISQFPGIVSELDALLLAKGR